METSFGWRNGMKMTLVLDMASASCFCCFPSEAIGSTGWFDFSVKYVFHVSPPEGIGRKRRCCEQEKLCQLGEEKYQKVHPDETYRAQHQNPSRDEWWTAWCRSCLRDVLQSFVPGEDLGSLSLLAFHHVSMLPEQGSSFRRLPTFDPISLRAKWPLLGELGLCSLETLLPRLFRDSAHLYVPHHLLCGPGLLPVIVQIHPCQHEWATGLGREVHTRQQHMLGILWFGLVRRPFVQWGSIKQLGDCEVFWPVQWLRERLWHPGSDCSNNWTSPCSSATLRSQHAGTCGVTDSEASMNTDWIGIEFESKQQVQCWQATFPPSIKPEEVQLFACPSAPPAAENQTCWNVEENCAPMYLNALTPDSQNVAWTSTDNKVSQDMSCSTEITVEVAKARWESFASGSDERMLNPIINCFCQQQTLSQGAGFAFPPYDTDEKMICEAWIMNNAAVVGKVVGAALAVLVINQVLLLIYEYLVAFERHCTVTEVTLSQFWKLFLAQMVNTALLVLLVNASLNLPPVLQFLQVFQVGSGQFDELSVTWYVSVGTGICITIFMQARPWDELIKIDKDW